MGDVTSIDIGRTRFLADNIGRNARTAGAVASEVRATLFEVDLPTTPSGLVDEIADELGALERFLRAVADRAEFADRFGASLAGQGWYEALRAGWNGAEADLRAGLNDGVGATPMQAADFTLAGSFVTISRAEWMRTAIPPGCEGYGQGRYYTGGGAIRGADGRLYPIVVPHYETDDEHYTTDAALPANVPSAASLGGSDPGWVVVDYRTGVEQVHQDVAIWQQLATGAAVMTGLTVPPSIDDEHLHGVRFHLGSRPSFQEGIPVKPGVASSPAVESQSIEQTVTLFVDGRAIQYSISELGQQNRAVRRAAERLGVSPATAAKANLPGNVATVAIGALQGASYAMSMNDSNSRAYEVIFEENADGRLRSRVQSFTLEPRSQGPILGAWHLFLDDDGRLMQSPVSYQSGPVITPGGAVLAANSNDPDYVRPVPNAELEGEE